MNRPAGSAEPGVARKACSCVPLSSLYFAFQCLFGSIATVKGASSSRRARFVLRNVNSAPVAVRPGPAAGRIAIPACST
jgi:hypothetical protein